MRRRQKLGLWMATALVLGNIIGSGIFLLPASLAPFGGLGLLSWGITGTGAIFLAIIFSRLSHRYPRVGGPYAFSRFAFGDFIGFQVAWGYWLAVWISTAALVVAAVSYLSVLFPVLNSSPYLSTFVALGIIWFFTFLNATGVKNVGAFQVLTTVLKLVPLLIVAILGWFFIHPQHFEPFNLTGQPPFAVITSAATLTLFAFIGLESATVPAEDVENPETTIPRATLLGTGIAAGIYILSTAAIIGIVPPEILAKSGAPFVDALQAMARPEYAQIIKILVVISAVISCLGATNGWILLQAQVPYAAAKDRIFPQAFAKLSKQKVPLFGLIFSSILMSLFLLLSLNQEMVERFNLIVIISTFTILVPYTYTSLAELGILVTGKEKFSKKRFTSSLFIASVAFIYSLWVMAGAGTTVVFIGALGLIVSIPVYAWMRWRYRDEEKP